MLDHSTQPGGTQAMQNQGTPSPSRPVVIVVDDDPAVRNSLRFSLEIEGFAVRTYAGATELLASRDVGLGACYVVDQKMPEMTGMELIGRLRTRHISAPAILITSQPNKELTARAARADVLIVEKPLLCDALLDRIRDACSSDDRPGH
jgi:FixJ family two-component response regulator